ncbi:MAG: ABC transporter substrate-binding protein [Sporichthyaceae bacterium]
MTRPRTHRLVPAAAAAVALALLAAGCGGSSGGGTGATKADPSAKVTLTWWTGQSQAAEKVLEGLAAEFHQAHPNVTVKASSGASTTDDLLQKLSATFASGTYPDISYAYGSWAGKLGKSGKTLDLADEVADPAVGWDELPPAARTTATPAGVVIGYPALVDNLALVYNTDLFDAAGLDYPSADWTWEDFRSAAQAISDPGKKIYGTAWSVSGGEDTTWHLWPLLWQGGGEILTKDEQKTAFDSPAGVQGLELLRQMAVEDKSMYLDQTDEKYGPLFAAGRVGMIVTGPWQLYDLVQAKTPYGVQVLPGTNGDHQTVSGPDIWAAFDHEDANRAHWTAELLSWLSQPEQDARWNMALGNLPLRSSEQSMPEYATFIATYPGVEVMVANLANATHARPTIASYPEISRYVGEAVAKTLQGQGSSAAALATAAEKADQAMSFQ